MTTDQYVEGTSDPIGGTRTTYDKAGRATKTERLLGLDVGLSGGETFVRSLGAVVSASETHYDNAGRVTSTVDQFDHETQTLYNAFGETVQTRSESVNAAGQPVWLVSRTVYDSLSWSNESSKPEWRRVESREIAANQRCQRAHSGQSRVTAG